MKALTLWRPWPWAIFHAPQNAKRIENRPWKPWASIIGEPIVLHAGKTFDKSAVDDILIETTPFGQARVLPARATDEGLIGIAMVTGYVTNAEAAAELAGQYQERWFSGPYAWLLTEVRAFPEPIPCKGKQGLWPLPMWAEQKVRAALREMGTPPVEHRETGTF